MKPRISHAYRSPILVSLLVLGLAVVLLGAGVPVVHAVSPNVVISQVYGGAGSSGATLKNDFIELFNRGSSPVNITGWSVQYTSASGTTWSNTTNLSGTLQPGQYYLVQEAAYTGTTSLPTPDATGTFAMAGGSGKVALVNNQTALTCGSNCLSNAAVIDFVGYGAANNFEGSAPAPVLSATTAAMRANGGCTDTDQNNVDFTAVTPAPRNTATTYHSCGGSTNPSGVGAANPKAALENQSVLYTVAVMPGTNPTSTGLSVKGNLTQVWGGNAMLFNDAASGGDVTAGDNIFSLTNTVDPGVPPGLKTITVTITDAQTRTGTALINLVVVSTVAPVHTIQGASHLSPLNGQLVKTQGIVIAKKYNGFWIQDPNPDADDATAEGISVFTSSAPSVNTGDLVDVSGTVKEYRASATNLTITELDNPGRTITILSSGNPLPAATVIGAPGRTPPNTIIEDDATGNIEATGVFDPAQDGIDFYESLEGMLVQVNDPVVVGPTNSNKEVFVVGDSGASAGLLSPRGSLVIQASDFNPERIQLDDGLTGTPSVNIGARLGKVTGTLDYNFGNFELLPLTAPTVVQDTIAQETTTTAPEHQLRVATFNAQNLAATDPPSKFNALAGQVVTNLLSPDIIALEEIQDNNGATNTGLVAAGQTITMLIGAILVAGGPAYDFRQIDPVNNQDGGVTGGNIRVGFLFRPDRVSFVDRPGGTSTAAVTVTNGATGPELSFSPGRIDPTNLAFTNSRKPLAGEFLFRGSKVFVIANHFNSKGGDDPLFGPNQPPVLTSEPQRLQQAQVVNNFVDSILALDPAANIVVAGDFNDFQFSNPLATLKGGVLANLLETLPPAEQYTYIYDGNAQALDHTLVSSAVFNRSYAFDVVHANAEFPELTRASDHDPQVAALCVDATLPSLAVSVDPASVAPPDHRAVTVTAAVTATDNADPSPKVELVGVTSSEADTGTGAGDLPGDIVVVNDTTFQLRAERADLGVGRTYTATYRAIDACGNVQTQAATVFVPFADEAIAGLTAGNDGPTEVGSATTFQASVTAGSNVLYSWDFGDGDTGSGATPSHTYSIVGVYTATVTTSNLYGSNTATTQVSVGDRTVTVESSVEATLVYTDTSGSTTVVYLPANAVDAQTEFLFTEILTPTVGQSGFVFAGFAFTLDAFRTGALMPGFTFAQPVTLTFHYADADIAGMDETTLTLFYWTGTAWEDAACGAYDRHPDANWLALPICHLSHFALFGETGEAQQWIFLPLIRP